MRTGAGWLPFRWCWMLRDLSPLAVSMVCGAAIGYCAAAPWVPPLEWMGNYPWLTNGAASVAFNAVSCHGITCFTLVQRNGEW